MSACSGARSLNLPPKCAASASPIAPSTVRARARVRVRVKVRVRVRVKGLRLTYCAEHARPQLREEIRQSLIEEGRSPLLLLDETEGVRRPDLRCAGTRELCQRV